MSDSAVPAVNVLIWLSVKPILKLAFPVAGGFALTRAGLYPVAGSRAASQIVLNLLVPSLLFAKVVPSITSENANAIGPIILVGFLLIAMNFLMGLVVRTLFKTPHNFRWGILAAATFSNWGDLPTAVVSTVCASAPFSGNDSDLAIAYVAIFILVFYIFLFPLRGIDLIKRDYTHPYRPHGDVEARASGRAKDWWRHPAQILPSRRKAHRSAPSDTNLADTLAQTATGDKVLTGSAIELPTLTEHTPAAASFAPLGRAPSARSDVSIRELAGAAMSAPIEETGAHNRRASFKRERERLRLERMERLQKLGTIAGSRMGSRAGSEWGDGEERDSAVVDDEDGDATAVGTMDGGHHHHFGRMDEDEELRVHAKLPAPEAEGVGGKRPWSARRVARALKGFVMSMATPPTISLILSLIIALVNPLKALFTPVAGYTWAAPDGDPPLAIILDTAEFVGNANVPVSLTVLGAALARMTIPRPFSRLPLASIVSLACTKLVLLPIFGFLLVRGLAVHTPLIDEDDRVLQFTCIFFAVVPTATSQVSLSQIFAPEGQDSNCDILSAYLIFQYAVFSISSVILTSVTLSTIF